MTDKYVFAPVEVFQDGRLTKMQLRVLLGILSFRDRKTTAPIHPKRATLARRVGYSEKVISRTTTELVKLGWLTKRGRGGYSLPTEYEFHVPDALLDSNTVTDSVTVDEENLTPSEKINKNSDVHNYIVTDSVTVTEPVTVTDSGPTTVTEPVPTTVTESVTGKQQTIITDHNNRSARSRASHKREWVLPEGLDESAWERWEDYRKMMNLKPYKTDLNARRLAILKPADQRRCVEDSIAQQYNGLFTNNFEKRKKPLREKDYGAHQESAA